MQAIPHLKIHLYKRWKFLFTGLIIFWLFIMIIFSVNLISLGGDYRRQSNIARKHASKMQYHFTYELEHMSMNDPDFGLFYKLENDHIAYFQNFTNVDSNSSELLESRLLNLTQKGNLTEGLVDLKQNLTQSNEVLNRNDGENVAPTKPRIISNDINLKNSFSSLQLTNKHRQPVIEDLPRDKISEQQIGDVKNKNWFKDKILQQNAFKTDDISRRNKTVYGKHVGTPIRANDMRPNNELLQQNRNLYGKSRINLKIAHERMLNLQNRWVKLQKEKRVMYRQPKIMDYRQGGYLSKSMPFQQPEKNQAFQAPDKGNYNRLLNGDQQILNQSNSFFNVKYNRNQIFQQLNRNTYKGVLFGIQSQNIPLLKDRVILHRKVVPFSIKRQSLLQHGLAKLRKPFKKQLFQKQSGNTYRKQGIKISSPFGFLKEKIIARNMPKNSVYQQQKMNFYNKLTRVAAPKLRNPIINYQISNNLLQKQSGYIYGRERLNGLPKGRPLLQNLLSRDSFNRRPISPQSRNVYNEQNIKLISSTEQQKRLVQWLSDLNSKAKSKF